MKIRKISLENLNSLVGEHELDLTAEPIGSAGIFAITGSTGAGKSTLLDAITLALYGRAARYDRPNPEDMMSRHQGKCRAEVEFEVGGEIFRAEWTRHRAREKADGKMQPAKRFIYDATGEVLTQSLSEADDKVEEICGLTYERFMRSALLAQGEFARFLKSKEDERAELLESLTGTEVFSELSAMVFAEATQRTRELEEAERLLGTISPLDPVLRQEKETALAALESEQRKVRAVSKEMSAKLLKAVELVRVVESMATSEKASAVLETERKENESQLAGLASHRAAESYFPLLSRVDDAEADAVKLHNQLEASSKLRVEASANLERGLASAAALLREWIREREESLALLRKEAAAAGEESRALDAWLKSHRSDATLKGCLPKLFENIETLRNHRANWSATHRKFVALEEERKSEKAAMDVRNKLLGEGKSECGRLQADYAELQKRLAKLSDGKDEGARRVEIERLENLVGLQEGLQAGEKGLSEARASLEPQREKTRAAVRQRKSDLELLEAHEEHLHTEALRAGLEEHRADLKDGEECPLCGALEHPFTIEGGVGSKADELKKKVAEAKLGLAKAEENEREQSKLLAQLEAKILADEGAREERLGEVRRGGERLGIGEIGVGEMRELIEKWTGELAGMAEVRVATEQTGQKADRSQRELEKLQLEQKASTASVAKLDRQLEAEELARRDAVRAGERSIADLEKVLDPFSEFVPLVGKEAELRQSLEDRAKQYDERESGLTAVLEAARTAALREEEIGKELKDLRERAAALEVPEGAEGENWSVDSMADLNSKLAALDTAATSAGAAAAEREKQVAGAKSELAMREATLRGELENSRFDGVDALRSLRMEPESLAATVGLEKRLSEEGERLKGRMESLAENLKRLREEEIPEGEVLAAIRLESQGVEKRVEEISDETSSVRAELKTDDRNRVVLKEKGAKLGESREQLKTWQRLNGLIGSLDGKKFRRFAQGLSLDVLVRHANLHLERLSERYQLARVEGEELGLEIVDLFQASVTRPMSSLSGGESFLASLALALGLSDLAGRNVQIDSLFIDEGFGSLDGDTLDEAISALEALRLREKTVGVISHVELLKERISTQVVVGLDAGGRAKIEVIG